MREDPYRTNDNVDALREEIARLRAKCSRRDVLAKQWHEWSTWVRDKASPVVVGIVIVAAAMYAASSCRATYYESQIACMPGWIEVAESYPSGRQWRVWDNRIICTDGSKRWVVER